MASCTQWFWAEDQDGKYPAAVEPEFVLKNFITGDIIGTYTIPQSGRSLTLDNTIRYRAIPLLPVDVEDDWILPPTKNFYGCESDVTFVWEKIICTPGARKCVGDDVHKCNSDGTAWDFQETCAHGCSGGVCNDPPVTPLTIDNYSYPSELKTGDSVNITAAVANTNDTAQVATLVLRDEWGALHDMIQRTIAANDIETDIPLSTTMTAVDMNLTLYLYRET